MGAESGWTYVYVNVSVEEESGRCESWSTSWVMLLIVCGVGTRSIACTGQCKAVRVTLTEATYVIHYIAVHFSLPVNVCPVLIELASCSWQFHNG